MPRNRRNIRRRRIRDYLNMKTFLTIVGILSAVIVICIIIQQVRIYQDKAMLAKQREELEQRTEQIFSDMESNINQTNQAISESDEIIKMSAVGDILCSQTMLDDAYAKVSKTYDFSHMFRKASGYITKADIIMGTMETNLAKGAYNSENAPKEFAKAVKESGINLVTISHNHSLDCGLQGLKETKECLQDLGYSVVGDRLDDNKENSVLIKTVKNTKIAFLTYTYGINNEKAKSKKELEAVNIYSEKQVKSDIEKAKELEAEYICVMIHWGDAISDKVTKEQKDMANFLVDNGVDMILGAHPSVVQPMEVKKNADGKNVFIAYSIGTYISTLSDDNAKVELVLNIELRKSGKDGSVSLNKVDYTPLYVLDNGVDADKRIELIDMKSTAKAYANGDTQIVSRDTYNKLIAGLNKLEKILSK